MALYSISDLHLALGADKPMDIFGYRWQNYMERLEKNWRETIGMDDVVIIPGDISWATYLEHALQDLRFIEALPGRKIISKGNHDYWWTTASKLEHFKDSNQLDSIRFMHNNSFPFKEALLCGTRGWKCPGEEDFSPEDMKIFKRELIRLELSLKSAGCVEAGQAGHVADQGRPIVVAMHYPPFGPGGEPSEFVELMKGYGVKLCIYGHLHGYGHRNAVEGELMGVTFRLVSADYLDFTPVRLDI